MALRIPLVLALMLAAGAWGCGRGLLEPKYEYEEELYLSLDGSATLNLNASIPALVALRGADLPTDPAAFIDRAQVRALFEGAGGDVTLSLSRRDGRRFVHASVEVDNLRDLARIAPFAWSTYRFNRRDDVFEYSQTVGDSAVRDIGDDVGWDGTEMVAFRMHLPSEILYENADDDVQRGNILEWEQPLTARLEGEPLSLEVRIATESILYTTLLLFGGTILAAAATFGAVLWWVTRRGRHQRLAESTS